MLAAHNTATAARHTRAQAVDAVHIGADPDAV